MFIYCRFERESVQRRESLENQTTLLNRQRLQYLNTRANSATNVRPLLLASRTETLKKMPGFRRLILPSNNDLPFFPSTFAAQSIGFVTHTVT